MNYIIQKFGGTSVGNAERIKDVSDIIVTWSKTHKVIVVVSAINSYNKAEGTTNNLIHAKKLAQNHGPYIKVIDEIAERHLTIVDELLADQDIHALATDQIKNIVKKLKSFLSAVEVIHETSPRIEDIIVSTGEKLSSLILSCALNQRGVDAAFTDLSDCVEDDLFEDAGNGYYVHLKEQISRRIHQTSGIPVLTGFFGHVPGGILKSVGRGYTDLTAALAAAALNASELQIWKEVDGIFTADPRKVPNARVIDSVTPAEAAELTYYGSEVIHPFTMEQVIKCDIPIRIKNTFNPERSGTIIDSGQPHAKPRKATAVTSKTGIYVLNVNSNRMQRAHGFIHKVFQILDTYKIPIDLISTSEVNISLTIEKKYAIKAPVKKLEELGFVSIIEDQAIVSLIGEGMKSSTGTASKFFSALSAQDINVEMITQGASEINISCVINENRVIDALNEVHRQVLE